MGGMFFVLEAQNFADYSAAIHASSSAAFSGYLIFILILNTKKAYQLFDGFEEIIERRKVDLNIRLCF